MKNTIALIILALVAVGCNSGGGNGGGAPGYTHNQLAQKFVNQLNLDPEFSVTLVKSSTLHDDFIVIYDPYTNTYDAIDIYSYNPAFDNAADYYFDKSYNHYYGLYKIPGYTDYYWDYDIYGTPYLVSEYIPTRYHGYGLVFEKTSATIKDLNKVAALREISEVKSTAKHLALTFGLSQSRANEIARLNQNWKKTSFKAMTAAEVDNFTTELLSFSMTDGIAAVKASAAGDSTKLNTLVKGAADLNGFTPEHAEKLMINLFNIQ